MLRLVAVVALASLAAAHMALVYPCPRFSNKCDKKYTLPPGAKYNEDTMTSPIGYGKDTPLCKSKTPWPQPVASWTAGQSVTIKFPPGGATHGGGHCQFSISYDGGNAFAVMYEVLGNCFTGQPAGAGVVGSAGAETREYTFKLPDTLPASNSAVFAWSWVNAIGNREFYMNCADVAISGTSSSYTGKAMVIANHEGYPKIPEFGGKPSTGVELYKAAKSITQAIANNEKHQYLIITNKRQYLIAQ
ncbi:hypothetical protein IWQ56_001039 [Coemansia nantahalensis]|nr:hypothetical protein IWQ56_001039 [Coemansia nantahalensis]